MPLNWLRKRRDSTGAVEAPAAPGIAESEADAKPVKDKRSAPPPTVFQDGERPSSQTCGARVVLKCKRLYKTTAEAEGKDDEDGAMELFRPKKATVVINIEGLLVLPEDLALPEERFKLRQIVFFHLRESPPVFEFYVEDPDNKDNEMGLRIPFYFKTFREAERMNDVVLVYVANHMQLHGLPGARPAVAQPPPTTNAVIKAKNENDSGSMSPGPAFKTLAADKNSMQEQQTPAAMDHLSGLPAMPAPPGPSAKLPARNRRRSIAAGELAPLNTQSIGGPEGPRGSRGHRRRMSFVGGEANPLQPIGPMDNGVAKPPEPLSQLQPLSNVPARRRRMSLPNNALPGIAAIPAGRRGNAVNLGATAEELDVDGIVLRTMKARVFLPLSALVTEVSAKLGHEGKSQIVEEAIAMLASEGKLLIDEGNYCKFLHE